MTNREASQTNLVMTVLAELVQALEDGRLLHVDVSKEPQVFESGPVRIKMGPDRVTICAVLLAES